MKTTLLRITCAACISFAALIVCQTQTKKPMPSPPADTSQTVDGKTVSIHYNAPSMRGRKIFGGLVPYDKVWRTGANPATALKAGVNLKIGSATVPAGSYTLYTLPSASGWKLIINKQTGQWGTKYDQSQDLARVDMKTETLSSPQEVMSITLEPFQDKTSSLHVRWETTDASVPVVAEEGGKRDQLATLVTAQRADKGRGLRCAAAPVPAGMTITIAGQFAAGGRGMDGVAPISRRRFAQRAAAGLAGVAVGSRRGWAVPENSARPFKLSVMLWTLRPKYTAEQAIDLVA